MDLGYSSSSDESDEGDIVTQLKRKCETEGKIDVNSIFSFSKPEPDVKRQKVDENIDAIIKQVIEDKIETESEEGSHLKIEVDGSDQEDVVENIDGVPSNAIVTDFNMNEFYMSNKKAIESGEIDSMKQMNLGNMKLHRGYNGNIANLQDIMKFNLNNEEKLTYKNNERISKEKANKKEKKG